MFDPKQINSVNGTTLVFAYYKNRPNIFGLKVQVLLPIYIPIKFRPCTKRTHVAAETKRSFMLHKRNDPFWVAK